MRVTFVTAASSNHANCAVNLLWTIQRFEPGCRTICYDLGLTEAERFALREQGAELRAFPFERYEPWVSNLKAFAWKPVVVQEVAREIPRGEALLWLDAGCLLEAPIGFIRKTIEDTGLYCPSLWERRHKDNPLTLPPKFDVLERWTNINSLEAMGIRPSDPLRQAQMRLTTIVGINPHAGGMQEVLDEWARLALIKAVISPEDVQAGERRQRHHFDMSTFTVVIERAAAKYGLRIENQMSEVVVQCDKMTLAEIQAILAAGESYRN